MAPKTAYGADDMCKAIDDVLKKVGSAVAIARQYGIPPRTLRTHVQRAKQDTSDKVSRRMGPSPTMPSQYEDDLTSWILGMESDGHAVGRKRILAKANAMMDIILGYKPQHPLTQGWYYRFLQRHPDLSRKKAHVLTAARRSITADDTMNFYHQLVHALSCVDMDPGRVFNMDETSFSPSKGPSVVVAKRSSKKVFITEPTMSAHVTVVACVGADGSKIPPLFVLPGDRVTTTVCDNLTIPGAAVTTSKKGWTNSYICRQWLTMLHDAVPATVKRPILLVVDGCSSHYSEYIVEESKRLNILLLFLPANFTHLFQPLDVSVFRPFKRAIRSQIADDMWSDVGYNVSKQQAIAVACDVWANSAKATTIQNGFASTGLCPPSVDALMYRLSLFQPPTQQSDPVQETWLERAVAVRKTILLLPPQKKRGQRKTLSVSGKFITAEYHHLLQEQADAAKSKKKTRHQLGLDLGSVETVVV